MEQAGIKALLYTAVLPIFGFVIFGILTIFPLFGLFLGTALFGFIYEAGAVPCLVTAFCFEIWFRKMRFAQSLFLTCAAGFGASIGWCFVLGGVPDRLNGGVIYVYFAFGLAGLATAAIMPLVDRAFQRRETNRYALIEADG